MKRAVATIAFLVPTLAAAGVSAKEGLSAGIELGARLFTKDLRDAAGTGPAVGFSIAWGVTDSFGIRLRWDGSLHTGHELYRTDVQATNWFTGPNLGATYSFLSGGRLQPFVDAGIGAYWFASGGGMMHGRAYNGYYGYDDGYDNRYDSLVSWGVQAGAGARYFMRDNVSLSATFFYLYAPFPGSLPGGPDTIEGTNLSMLLGIAYHFGGGLHCPMCGMMHHGDHGKAAHDDEQEKPAGKEEKGHKH